MSTTPSDYQEKITTAEAAVASIRSGDHVFVGTACATPSRLVHALEASQRRLKDVQLIHFIADDVYPQTEDGELTTRFQHKVFFVGMDDREAIKQGKANYIPIPISQLPRLIESGRIPIDVALIQTTPPDGHGYVSLGVSVDITRAAVMNARKVIAEINPNMPWTHGDSFISVDKIDHMVEVDTPVKTFVHPPVNEVAEKMARYVASIIDDGSTLQIGLGRVPNGMLKYLKNRRNLGIHSDVICEEIIDLIEEGIITGDAKTYYRGQIVTSYCMGVTRRLYDFIDHNPMFSFHPIEFVCDPANISRNRKMVSVSQAWAVDLNGQVCTDQLDGELYSGVSTQPDFIRGAANSVGGKPIICLPSTTDDGSESRIRPLLREGEAVTIPRSDVHYVVTEFGVAYIYAKSLSDRALRLIQIAHPDFRPGLLEEAKRLGYVREGQVLESKVSYPVNEERTVT
ncbi:MAG: acetyl-CoA hydrolase/transferase C-terminal domain-containing protein, partial [Desulfobacterales bacterium]